LLSRAEARQQLGLKEGDCVIGTIGRLVAKKRHEVLIKGFAELANQRLKLLIVGEGLRRKELQELTEKLGVEQQVVFAGFHARANRLVKAIDVFVLSSGEEAFGVVILEAMLGKIPVVSSDVSGPVDVLGGTGTLFCQGDTDGLANRLAFLVKQTDDGRKRSAEAGYIRVKQEFGYESFRKKVWSLPDLQQVLIE
jgi:glycosyltransferase involved in cell wall biosynthesis